jgi:hypothetical protein
MSVLAYDDRIDFDVEFCDVDGHYIHEFDGKQVIIEMMELPAVRAYVSRWFQ